jgi:titin
MNLRRLFTPRAIARRQNTRRWSTKFRLEVLEDRLAPAVSSSVTFAQIGDYGLAGPAEQAVANLVNGWFPNFIITTGDNNYSTPSASTYDTNVGQYYHNYISPYPGSYGSGAATNSFFPTLGEHDWNNPGVAPYLSYFNLSGSGRYYTVTEGPVQLFALDSNASETDGNTGTSVQAAWLKSQLATSTAPWKLVYFSEAPYSSGSTHGSSAWMQWPFQQWGASAVIAGHEHNYERLNVNGMPYFVDGLGGASIYPFGTPLSTSQVRYNADYGAMLVTATPSQITFQFINEAGSLIDSYTMNYPLPAAPSSLTATPVSGTQIGLTWTNNDTNATGYNILRSTDGVNFAQIASVGAGVSQYVDSGLSSSTTYYYQVDAYNAGGSSASSNSSSSTPIQTAPTTDAPTNLVATAIGNQVNLTWTDNSGGADSFAIYRSANGSSYAQIATVSSGVTSYADGGLTPASYYYRVIGLNTGGGTVPTSVVGVTLAPSGPSNLTATVAGTQEIDLTWTANSSNQTGFAISRSTDGVNFTQIATVGPGITTYASIGLTPASNYYYQVSAVNAGGQASSATVSGTTNPSTPPAAPTSLSAAVISATQVNLAWNSNSGGTETGFKIYDSTDGVNYNLINAVGSGITSFTAVGLAPSSNYYFEVAAYNIAGTSGTSNAALATTMALPAAPSNLTATATTAYRISLSWTSNTAGTETGFRIYRSTNGGVSYSWRDTVGQGVTTYLDTGLSPTTTYNYEVMSYNAAGLSNPSNAANATTMALPAAPTNLTASAASGTTINLSWTSNSGGTESGFKIYKSTDGINFSWSDTIGTGVTTYTASSLANGKTYYFQVQSYNGAGNSASSNTASATTLIPPAAASSLTATASSATQINLSWTSNSGGQETGFKIYQSTDGGVTFSWHDTVSTAVTTYSDTGLSASTTYYFEIVAYSTAAGNGSPSNVASTATPAVPAAPSNLGATSSSSTQANLTWTDNSYPQETGFKIYRSTDGGVTYGWHDTVGQGVTTYTDTGLNGGATYYYEVRAYNSAGNSAFSNAANVTTPAPPAAASNLTATTLTAFRVSLAWTSNSGGTESGFKIYKSTDGVNYNWTDTVGTGVTTYSATGLKASTTYYFEVRAYNSYGNAAYSNAASATTKTLPAAASNLTVTAIVSGRSTLTWTDNSTNPEEDGFRIYRSTDGVNFSWSDTVGRDVTTYTATGLSSSTVYYYEIRSYISNDGAAIPSNWAGTNGTSGQPSNPQPLNAEMAGSNYAEPNDLSTLPTVGWSGILGQSAQVNVYVDNPDGTLTTNEYISIANAIATLNASGVAGLNMALVSDPSQANVVIENSVTSNLGGQAAGVLGDAELNYTDTGAADNGLPYLQISGPVVLNMIEGWNWYTGSDPTAIGAGQYDYETVVLHELGHAVGLNYHDPSLYGSLNGDGHSVMYGALNNGQARREYSSYDVSWLNHLYGGAANPGPFSGVTVTSDAIYANGSASEDTPITGTIGARMAGFNSGVPAPTLSQSLSSAAAPGQQPSARLIASASPNFSFLAFSVSGLAPSQVVNQLEPQSPNPGLAKTDTGPLPALLAAIEGLSTPTTVALLQVGSAAENDRMDSGWGDGFLPGSLETPLEQAPAVPQSDAPAPGVKPAPLQDQAAGSLFDGEAWVHAATSFFAMEIAGAQSEVSRQQTTFYWADTGFSDDRPDSAVALVLAFPAFLSAQPQGERDRKRYLLLP